MSPLKRYIFDGQSLGVGTKKAGAPAGSGEHFYAGYGPRFMAQAHPELPYTIANIGGTRYDERESSVHPRVDQWLAMHPDNVLIDDGGGSDLGAADDVGKTAEEVLAIKRAYCDARREAGAQYIVGLTNTPGINQPDSVFWYEAEELEQINRLNDFLRDDPALGGYDRIVDIAAIPELMDPTNLAYYYDGIHFTDVGAELVADLLVAEGI